MLPSFHLLNGVVHFFVTRCCWERSTSQGHPSVYRSLSFEICCSLAPPKKNVTVRWAKFLFGKVRESSWRILCLQNWVVAWNIVYVHHHLGGMIQLDSYFFRLVETIHQKRKGSFYWLFFDFFSVIFMDMSLSNGKLGTLNSPRAVLMVSLPESNEFSFWKLMVWVRWNSLKLGEGGQGKTWAY